MFGNSNMMTTNYLLEKSLDVESLRRKVISNNVSNVDVPHFKRSEVNFESELKRAVMQREQTADKLPSILTDEKHIPFFLQRDLKSVSPRVNLDYSTSQRNDGNNVDIEKEMVNASKNMMRYNAFVASMNHNFKLLKLAMRSV